MKKLVVLFATIIMLVATSAWAEVKFRSDVDHWSTEAEARSVPMSERKYYVPYFNLHNPLKEPLASWEKLETLEEDTLFLEKVPERLGGIRLVWWEKGSKYVLDTRTGQKAERDPRCGNWAKEVQEPKTYQTPLVVQTINNYVLPQNMSQQLGLVTPPPAASTTCEHKKSWWGGFVGGLIGLSAGVLAKGSKETTAVTSGAGSLAGSYLDGGCLTPIEGLEALGFTVGGYFAGKDKKEKDKEEDGGSAPTVVTHRRF